MNGMDAKTPDHFVMTEQLCARTEERQFDTASEHCCAAPGGPEVQVLMKWTERLGGRRAARGARKASNATKDAAEPGMHGVTGVGALWLVGCHGPYLRQRP